MRSKASMSNRRSARRTTQVQNASFRSSGAAGGPAQRLRTHAMSNSTTDADGYDVRRAPQAASSAATVRASGAPATRGLGIGIGCIAIDRAPRQQTVAPARRVEPGPGSRLCTLPVTRFQDRVVLVTGAASGIGRAVAERLGDEGAHVVALDVQREGL